MQVESDVYIKFGNDPADKDNYPLIEGDCTDETHKWWCELRNCGFNLTVPDHSKLLKTGGGGGGEGEGGSGDGKEKTKPKTKWEKVSLKKRVDWASTQLFLRCCKAGRQK